MLCREKANAIEKAMKLRDELNARGTADRYEKLQPSRPSLDENLVGLEIEQLWMFEEEDGTTLTKFSGGVRVEVTDSLGQQTLSECNEVRYKNPESILTLAGNVRINGFNGRRLTTDTLIWDRSTRQIRTEGFIIMVTESDSIRGYGLRATSDLSDYSILNVTGSTTIKRSSSL